MLFAYTYVPHQMEKMQEFIDFIFLEVWCRAPGSGPFDVSLFTEKPELHEVMESFYYSDAEGADFFYGSVERIYGLFVPLTPLQLDLFRQWYNDNNSIEKVCSNDPAQKLVRYVDIPVEYKSICDELAPFFKGLYSKSLLDLAALKDKIGRIDDHYNSFMRINDQGKCPFCGISDIFGEYHTKREAYDHYLPKALYPFNSINFRNLAPACHHCNSSYKTSKDPAYLPKDPVRSAQRRKVLYPYRENAKSIQISVTLAHSDFEAFIPAHISIAFGPEEIAEELETWQDVYGIEERYKAKFLSRNDGKYWITQALDEWPKKGGGVAELLGEMTLKAVDAPFADCNFLKSAYLQGCYKAGIIREGDGGS